MRRSRIVAAGAGFVAALATLATASAQTADGGVGSGVTSFGFGDWVGLGLRLALVVAVIWAAVAGMRWYVRRMHQGGSRNGLRALEVIETHALGPNRSLHLVRLGDRAVLVGATQERITQLMTVDDPEELRRLTERPEEESVSTHRVGTMSVLSSLRTGLMVMHARRAQMNARARSGRDRRPRSLQAEAPAEEDGVDSIAPSHGVLETVGRQPRFRLLRRALPRRRRRAETLESEPESHESLFDRTLASIDAIEIAPPVSTAAGLRARASYGQARTRTAAGAGGGQTREQQIADLQRAIEVARRTAS